MSKEIEEKLKEVEHSVMGGLKDFQRATVERVDHLFRNGQDRILVADEVGMGKTMIAKGVIAKFSNLRYEEGDDLVKVVYICSNQSIANQNIEELDVFKTGFDDVANTRLSMQHLMIKKSEDESKGKYLQLIPLTPQTSFKQTSGTGNVNERFIMYLVLRQLPIFDGFEEELEAMLQAGATTSWDYWKYRDESNNRYDNYNYKTLVEEYENYAQRDATDPSDIFNQLSHFQCKLEEIAHYLKEGEENWDKEKAFIIDLRQIFATISVNMLNPDLVIMDEFQRFQFLISDKDSETKTLTDKFLTPATEDVSNRVRVLLLSATPYKLYSTLEELGDSNNDEPYREFNQVIKFLNNDPKKFSDFSKIWDVYSASLKVISTKDYNEIKTNKEKAEQALYNSVCRTERISVMDNGDYIDDQSKNTPLDLNHPDILAHVDVAKLLANTDLGINFPIDYIKSCPYALSYMNKYETKRKIRHYFDEHKKEVAFAKSKLLWLNKEDIKKYKEVKGVNARLERLKNELFIKQDTSLLLWMPPCRPYYNFGGVFQNKENYSKILIFSSWEMVPRMIGSLISYEEERKTIARLIYEKRQNATKQIKAPNYFARGRYPSPRLVQKNGALTGLIYPSRTLSSLYDPIDSIKKGLIGIVDLEEYVSSLIRARIDDGIKRYEDSTMEEDQNWYHVLPILLDGIEYAKLLNNKHINNIIELIEHEDCLLGKMPSDLVEVLTNIAIASPANCFLRIFNSPSIAIDLAEEFVRYFNSPEATAIVELAVKKIEDEGNHWKNTLVYCKQGNIQSMLDEYVHLLTKGKGILLDDSKESQKERDKITQKIKKALNLQSATYKIESFDDFELKVNARKNAHDKEEIEKTGSSLRSHFAAAFSKSDSTENEKMDRKDALRIAFNSPFWPFALASTSIGQEGLDFHLYCRKIMHWNLPSNPIDLEQREGRINRYKCLAIRQNVAATYGNTPIKKDSKDIWNDLFEAAQSERKENQSELIPFWCFGSNQKIKIERILAQYPLSKDEEKYERLIKVLSLYRLTLGQARQEELLTHIFHNYEKADELKDLFIDLSPFSHQFKQYQKEETLTSFLDKMKDLFSF